MHTLSPSTDRMSFAFRACPSGDLPRNGDAARALFRSPDCGASGVVGDAPALARELIRLKCKRSFARPPRAAVTTPPTEAPDGWADTSVIMVINRVRDNVGRQQDIIAARR
jgi:hypothetical protein